MNAHWYKYLYFRLKQSVYDLLLLFYIWMHFIWSKTLLHLSEDHNCSIPHPHQKNISLYSRGFQVLLYYGKQISWWLLKGKETEVTCSVWESSSQHILQCTVFRLMHTSSWATSPHLASRQTITKRLHSFNTVGCALRQ